jgi:hypothetical protein
MRQGGNTPPSEHIASEQSSRNGARPSRRQNHREDTQSRGSAMGGGGHQPRGDDERSEGRDRDANGGGGVADDRLRVELGRQEGVAMEARATAAAAQQVTRRI